jgi:transposase-like protein
MNYPLAIKVYKDYYACPQCSNGKDVVNLAAVYHVEALTHRCFCCKDCGKDFLVPPEVKIKPIPTFHKRE